MGQRFDSEANMKMNVFVGLIQPALTLEKSDRQLYQIVADIHQYPELGNMDVTDFFRAALKQIPCPACEGRGVKPDGCNYCASTGTVDQRLVQHPMNLRHLVK